MKVFWRTMLWDWKQLSRQRTGWLALALALGLSLPAAWNGARFAAQWQAQVERVQRDAGEARTQLLADIASGDAWASLPLSAEGVVALPPAPLASLASGRADLDPRSAKATTFGKRHELFRHYEIDSPLALALGRFDLAFVIQVLLPLLVIALGYGILAEERERGLDRVLAVQGVGPRRLLAARLLARALVLLAPLLLVVPAMHAAVADAPQRPLRLGWALLLIVGYLAF